MEQRDLSLLAAEFFARPAAATNTPSNQGVNASRGQGDISDDEDSGSGSAKGKENAKNGNGKKIRMGSGSR